VLPSHTRNSQHSTNSKVYYYHDRKLYSSCKVSRRFRGIYCLHLESGIGQARHRCKSWWQAKMFSRQWLWRQSSVDFQCTIWLISHKTVPFITTDVRTLNLIYYCRVHDSSLLVCVLSKTNNSNNNNSSIEKPSPIRVIRHKQQ
jgi:hypothetical protein